MPQPPAPKCYMCHRRPRPLTAHRDGEFYVNAENVVLFCSVRCAANYGLLWGGPAVSCNEHYCPSADAWKPTPVDTCPDCNPE